MGICQPFLGSWKIKPTWFLPSAHSSWPRSPQLGLRGAEPEGQQGAARDTRYPSPAERGALDPQGREAGVAAKPSRAWGRSAGRGAGDVTDAPINTRFGAWGLCLGLGRWGHGRQEEQGGRSGAQRSSAQGGGGGGRGLPAGPAEHLGERPRRRPGAKHRMQPARRPGSSGRWVGGKGGAQGQEELQGPLWKHSASPGRCSRGGRGVRGDVLAPSGPTLGVMVQDRRAGERSGNTPFSQHIGPVDTRWPMKALMARSHLCSL